MEMLVCANSLFMKSDHVYFGEQPMQVLYQIGKGEPPAVPNSLSEDARDFINHCLQVDPSARPTATQLLEHPFVKQTLPSSLGSASPLNLGRRL